MKLSVWTRGTLTASLLFLTSAGISKLPQLPEPLMISELVKGTERGHSQAGREFASFREHLPAKGILSFIQDKPYDKAQLTPERLLMLQNFLAPLVLSPDPGYPLAILECSSHQKAMERAAETGYIFLYDDLNGRGVLTRAS